MLLSLPCSNHWEAQQNCIVQICEGRASNLSSFVTSGSNISTTSARVLSGVPNTEKQMKARGRRPSAFIVSRCLERLMKPEARVFEMASQTSVQISWNFFRRIGYQKV